MNTLKLTKEQQDEAIRTIQSYFQEERGEELGDLAAWGGARSVYDEARSLHI
ncbi:DUF2164 family protein [Paenibacillus sp. FSL K6-2862]|uniref:DUF2164 family protein n=1 Tax=Paenibacillus sp. FSL K6-2862 TaxID=2921484 RepID=UPI0030F55745